MNKLALTVLFSTLINIVRGDLNCRRIAELPAGTPNLKDLYDDSSLSAHKFEDLDFPTKYREAAERLGSFSVYKYSLKVMQNPFAERLFPDGSTDFGVTDCQVGDDGVYVRRLHLLPAEWIEDLDKTGAVPKEPDAKVEDDYTVTLKDGKLTVPIRVSRYGNKQPKNLGKIKNLDFYEFPDVNFLPSGVQKCPTCPLATLFGKHEELPSNEPVNIINMMNNFDPARARFVKAFNTYFGVQINDDQPIPSDFWKGLKTTMTKTQRLAEYIKLAKAIETWANFGYVHNELSMAKFLKRGDDYAVKFTSNMQNAGETQKLCGAGFNSNPLITSQGARVTALTDIIFLALSIVHIEYGYPSIGLVKVGVKSPIKIPELAKSENKQKYIEYFSNAVQSIMAPIWGEPNASAKSEVGENLTSTIMWIIREFPQDLTMTRFRAYLEDLKAKTTDRIVV